MRSLRSYLLLPRPKDAVKWWIFPLGFGIGVLADGASTGTELLRAVVVWVALELLIYQARYQWNDIRGFAADQRHPDAAGRGRLPGPAGGGRSHIWASAAVAIVRVGAALLLAVLFAPIGADRPIIVLAVAVFGVAVVYEALRSVATGRTSAVPPPVRPSLIAVWVVVGGGYAIRGTAGVGLALDLSGRPLLAATTVLAMWAFGVAFVTGRWVIEGLSYATVARGRITWRAAHAREHSLALARWLPREVPGEPCPSADEWRPLCGPTHPSAPWNVAYTVAAGCAALNGRLLAGPATVSDAVAPALAGALLGIVVLATHRRAIAVPGCAALLVVTLLAAASPRPLLAALPWLLLATAHAFFAAQSLATLGHPLRTVRPRRPAEMATGRPATATRAAAHG